MLPADAVVDGVSEIVKNSFVLVLELTSIGGCGLFGRRLQITRIVITSLMMSGCCRGTVGQLCGEEEFYDAVVDECALCSDVCDMCLAPESAPFCSRNCPGTTLSRENTNQGWKMASKNLGFLGF